MMAPCLVMVDANCLEVPPPAEVNAISMSLKSSLSLSSFTVSISPLNSYWFPALRGDPNNTNSSNGNSLSWSTRRNSCPTAPLTPTTATFILLPFIGSKCKNRNYFHEFRWVFIIFSLLPHLLFGQWHFDFEIDSVSASELCPGTGWEQVPEGRWNCSTADALAGEFSLKHEFDNPESGVDFLVYSHDRIDPNDSVLFSFRIRHGYTPSSANSWQIAFGAEFSPESQLVQKGIVVGVNFLASDDLVKIWNFVD